MSTPCVNNSMKRILPNASRSDKTTDFQFHRTNMLSSWSYFRSHFTPSKTKLVVLNYRRNRWSKTLHTSSNVFRYRGFSVCVLCTTFVFCSNDKAFPRTLRVALKITMKWVGLKDIFYSYIFYSECIFCQYFNC